MRATRWAAIGLILVVSGLIGLTAQSISPAAPGTPASCPVTIPARAAFTPPPPYPSRTPFRSVEWFGTPELWTLVPPDGRYVGLHLPTGYRQKMFWWHPGYDGPSDPRPAFTLTAQRLDAPAPLYRIDGATNAHHDDFGGWTMLVMPDIPQPGCWQLTGEFKGFSTTYVVWVVP